MPREKSKIELLPTIWRPWMGEMYRPVRVPVTTPTTYLSFSAALNLRLPGEHTGDWHYDPNFFAHVDHPHIASRAGPGFSADTTPSLGSKGVRDMADLLATQEIIPAGVGPFWVANHYRAIADWGMLDMQAGNCPPKPMMTGACTINQWLDTPEQVEHLVKEYLRPLRTQLTPTQKAAFDQWIPTVVWLP